MHRQLVHFFLPAILLVLAALTTLGESLDRALSVPKGATVSIVNRYGKIEIQTVEPAAGSTNTKCGLTATSDRVVQEREVVVANKPGRIEIEVKPVSSGKRIDLRLTLPDRSSILVETADGAVTISGDPELIEATTVTGTVAVDVPPDNLKYDLLWTESRPRFVSDIELNKMKERSGGKFVIHGATNDPKSKKGSDEATPDTAAADPSESDDPPLDEEKQKDKKKKRKNAGDSVTLRFTTARGIMLLNVPPNEVSSDLRERPLTDAAKAIIRSGDSFLMDAIRRASPKYFGDYLKTLPPIKLEPAFAEKAALPEVPIAQVKRALVRVIDEHNRTVSDLASKDFSVTESGEDREIVSVQKVTAPVNLILLLDVSGSVENYETFIRKAARSFVDTVSANDRIAIITFNDDVNQLTPFSTDKVYLSTSLDSFEAGGGTAYYDALAYTLADVLRPFRGERTAIVVLTDGDDNRSFLSFDSLKGSIQESGSLIYPLYVPSTLIAASAAGGDFTTPVDPLRTRYMGLTTKAEGEGDQLAKISGGRYYPISQLSQIQAAYNDIVEQLRTAYYVTYRGVSNSGRSPKLRVKTERQGATVTVTSVIALSSN
jgi:VWFA-related protein